MVRDTIIRWPKKFPEPSRRTAHPFPGFHVAGFWMPDGGLAADAKAQGGRCGQGSRSGRIQMKFFDRNSRVRFHKRMSATAPQNAPVLDLVYGLLVNHTWAAAIISQV